MARLGGGGGGAVLRIGVEVAGVAQIEQLNTAVLKTSKVLNDFSEQSILAGKANLSMSLTTPAIVQAYKELQIQAEKTYKSLNQSMSGRGFDFRAKIEGEVAAISKLQAVKDKYIASLASLNIAENANAQAIDKKTRAINAERVALKRLQELGVSTAMTKVAGVTYVEQLAGVEQLNKGRANLAGGATTAEINSETRSMLAQEKGLQALATQMSELQAVKAALKSGAYQAEINSETRSMLAQEKGLQALATQMSELKAVKAALKSGAYQAEINSETRSMLAQEKGLQALTAQTERLRAARAALRAGNYAAQINSEEKTFRGREALAVGGGKGGYDYAQQIKNEEALYDKATNKLKTHIGGINEYHSAMARGVGPMGMLSKMTHELTGRNGILHSTFRGISGAMGTLWLSYGSFIPMLAGFAAAAGTIKTVKLGAEFDDIARQAVFLGGPVESVSGKIAELKERILGLRNLTQSPVELMKGALEFQRVEIKPEEALQKVSTRGNTSMMEDFSRFSEFSKIPLDKTIQDLTGISRAFNDGTKSAAEMGIEVANTVMAIANVGRIDPGEMLKAFQNVVPLGAVLKFNLQEVAAAIGVVTDRGIGAATAGTALTTTFLNMNKPTKELEDSMRKYSVSFNLLDESTGKVKNLSTALADFSRMLQKLPKQGQIDILEGFTGKRGIRAAGPLTEEQIAGFEKVEGILKAGGKSFEEFGAEAEKSYGKIEGMKTLLTEMGTAMEESVSWQLKGLKRDVDELFLRAYDDASVVQMVKEFRSVVTDPATLEALKLLLEYTTKLATLAAKGIVIAVEYIEEGTRNTMAKVGSVVGGVGGAGLAMATTPPLAWPVTIPVAGTIGAKKVGEGFGAVGDWMDQPDASKMDAVQKANATLKELEAQHKAIQARVDAIDNIDSSSGAALPRTAQRDVLALQEVTKAMDDQKKKVWELEAAKRGKTVIAQMNADKLDPESPANKAAAAAKSERIKREEAEALSAGRAESRTPAADLVRKQIDDQVKAHKALMDTELGMIDRSTEEGMARFNAAKKTMDEKLRDYRKDVETNRRLDLDKAQKQDAKKSFGELQGERQDRQNIKDAATDVRSYANATRDSIAVSREWTAEANKTATEMERLNKTLDMAGMTEGEKRIYNLNERLKDGAKTIADYEEKMGDAASAVGGLESQLSALAGQMGEAETAFAKTSLSATEIDVKTHPLVALYRELAKQLEAANKAKDRLEGQKPRSQEQFKKESKEAEKRETYKTMAGSIGAAYTTKMYDEELDKIIRNKKTYEESTNDKAAADRWLYENRRRLEESRPDGVSWAKGMEYGLQDVADQARQASNQIAGAIVGAFDKGTDAILEFVETGKASFDDMFESLLHDLTRLAIQQQITGPIAGMLGLQANGTLPAAGAGAGAGATALGAIGAGAFSYFKGGKTPEAPTISTEGFGDFSSAAETTSESVYQSFSTDFAKIGDDITSTMSSGSESFVGFADTAMQMGDSLFSFLKGGFSGLLDMIGSAGSAISGMFGSGGGGDEGGLFSGIASMFGSMFASAKGNVFDSPGLSAYSNSIVSKPTIFPFAKGTGLMGEAGPEAIMPLMRTSDGKLGVAAQGGGDNRPNIEVNISTPQGTKATVEQSDDGMTMNVLIEQIDNMLAHRAARGKSSLGDVIGRRR